MTSRFNLFVRFFARRFLSILGTRTRREAA